MIKFINESTGKEVMREHDNGEVEFKIKEDKETKENKEKKKEE